MKWNEIPNFLEYEIPKSVSMGFIRYVEFIEEEIRKYNLQMNPDFQRGNVWTEEQQIAYIEFILRGGKSGRDFYFNWNQKTNDYVCVDGLQRTNAFTRFVNGEIKVFNQYFDEFCFTGREAGVIPIRKFSVNVYMSHLVSMNDVIQWYVDMNSGGTVHAVEEIASLKRIINKI